MTGLVLLSLAVLLQSPMTSADSGVATSFAEIVGDVRTTQGEALGFLNVVILGTKLGTQTDEGGRFRLSRVPPGQVLLRYVAIGFGSRTDTLLLKPGETRNLVVRLERPQDTVDWAKVGLDPELRTRMRRASSVHVARLNSRELERHDDPEGAASASLEPSVVTRSWARSLLRLLDDRRLYWASAGHVKKLCIFQPGVGVRFGSLEGVTEVKICYECGQFLISSWSGLRQWGDFHARGADFLKLGWRAFPQDSAFRRLSPAQYAGWDKSDPRKRRRR